MKKITTLLIFVFILSGCSDWGVSPQPFPVLTTVPTHTPSIITATPIILTPTPLLPGTSYPEVTVTPPIPPTSTETPIPTLTFTTVAIIPTETAISAPIQSVSVDILGCNTSIDITHGMGEVTNAFVTLKNTGTIDLPNTCALLRAADEDRIHPDKKVCIANLPIQNQVTLKLTVDSAYKQNTVIQVDASSNDVVLLRVDKPSCTDIGLFGGAPSDVGLIKPTQP